jgi:hypothetical protein
MVIGCDLAAKLKPAHPWKSYVKNDATDSVMIATVEVLLG